MYRAGLHNVAVTDTVIGDVRGDEGFYHYRQYDATDLARNGTFEDVWYLFETRRAADGWRARAVPCRHRRAARRFPPSCTN